MERARSGARFWREAARPIGSHLRKAGLPAAVACPPARLWGCNGDRATSTSAVSAAPDIPAHYAIAIDACFLDAHLHSASSSICGSGRTAVFWKLMFSHSAKSTKSESPPVFRRENWNGEWNSSPIAHRRFLLLLIISRWRILRRFPRTESFPVKNGNTEKYGIVASPVSESLDLSTLTSRLE